MIKYQYRVAGVWQLALPGFPGREVQIEEQRKTEAAIEAWMNKQGDQGFRATFVPEDLIVMERIVSDEPTGTGPEVKEAAASKWLGGVE